MKLLVQIQKDPRFTIVLCGYSLNGLKQRVSNPRIKVQFFLTARLYYESENT